MKSCIRETSRQAYLDLCKSGAREKVTFMVFQAILEATEDGRDITQAEASTIVAERRGLNPARSSYGPRFITLERAAWIRVVGTRKSTETGQSVQAYRATGFCRSRLPKAAPNYVYIYDSPSLDAPVATHDLKGLVASVREIEDPPSGVIHRALVSHRMVWETGAWYPAETLACSPPGRKDS